MTTAAHPAAGHTPALHRLERALTSRLAVLLEDVGDRLADGWPEYAQFLRDGGGDLDQVGALFVRRLVDMAERNLAHVAAESPDAEPAARAVFEHVGRTQWQQGHELTELLTAYQVGARMAWRHVSATALELDLAPEVLAALAEAVFLFVNQLSAATAHGFVQEQSEASAERERIREDLAELLLSDRAETAAVHAAAHRAAWPLPLHAAVVLIDPSDRSAQAVVDRLSRQGLPIRRPDLHGAIVPTPGARLRDDHAAMLRGAHVVVGHPVPLTLLPATQDIARIALSLRRRGLLTDDPVYAGEHLHTIIVQRDARLIEALRRQVLEPIGHLSPNRQARLVETLTSWLRHMGDRQAVADELHIHPQTVRYRLGQLREHFGDRLDSAPARARMFIALVSE
jgi:DNA-binding PucR family transcriptional regulator